MDGNEPQTNLISVRSVAFGTGLCVALCVTTGWSQVPWSLGPQVSAKPIQQSVIPSHLIRPAANLIAADKSPFQATLTTPRIAANPRPSTGAEQTSSDGTGQPTGSETAPLTVAQALQMRGSVTFRKTPLSEVIFLLSDLWHINIVAGEDVSGDVSGSFHDAPLSEVLAAILTSSGYSYRKTGSSLVVLSADQIGVDDPSFASETLRLPPSLREDASTLEAASLLLSERGELKKIGSDLVLVIDAPERIQRVRSLFDSLTPSPAQASAAQSANAPVEPLLIASANTLSGISYFTPQFTEAEEMAESLREALGEGVIVAIFAEENRIMVKGTPADLRLANQIIEQLDKPRQQVRITAMIYDVSLTELEKLGVNWSRDIRALANGRNDLLENVTESVDKFAKFSSDLTTTGATSIGIRTLTGSMEASVFLEALDSTSEAKLLADPSITVGDRRQASIRIVRQIPIVGANPVQNSNAVFTQTEFKEAGVILNVQPRISRDGTIELNVEPEYSVVAEITASGPVIDSRTAQTIVRVGNGQMFVLGGLRQTSIVESQRGIPYLKDIKYVGNLFRSHDTEVRESELIVFLRPEIISPYYNGTAREREAARVSNQQLDDIAHASVCPQTENCKDPYCPNHCRRPRINAGSPGLPMIGGDGLYDSTIDGMMGDSLMVESIVIPQHGVLPPGIDANETFYPLVNPGTNHIPMQGMPTGPSQPYAAPIDDGDQFAPVIVAPQSSL
ncbi:Type II secretion system protein D precursor [Rubripirellula lacrimiformis]|uniref:Type II secretion system protein D n=1 Tax=Rubripirellula lacrimiformis TaxID=1930273 RepID=A0A517NJ07_9BACT|nr:secretin N-terminal domain-containing protein [Rubripirellula lacrimiformis]QDT07116.1 Type II secretion system protein D precursor [Rubripirellula lacrimiformis]